MSTATALERARTETDAVRDSAATPVATAEQMEITDLVSCQQAAGVLGEIAGILKDLDKVIVAVQSDIAATDKKDVPLLDEFNAAARQLYGLLRQIIAADKTLRKKYSDYYVLRRFAGENMGALQPMRGVRGGTVTVKMVKDFEIVDSSKLERAFMKPDMAAIRRAVEKKAKEIPGVKIVEKPVVSVRE